jgi:hypothetical protein
MSRVFTFLRWAGAAGLLASIEAGAGDRVAGAVAYAFLMVAAALTLTLPTLFRADEEAANERR